MYRYKRLFVYGVFIVVILLLIYRCYFGFDWSDETYYIALPYRFIMGNSLFSDSWDIHQTSAVMLVPLVSLYRAIHGSSDGIILFCRICFIVFQSAISLLIFKIIKKYTDIWCALYCAVLFLVFTPVLIGNFSYNSLSLAFLCVTCILLIDNLYSSVSRLKIYLSGICYALAVQAYPFVIITLPFLFIFFLIKFRNCKVWIYYLLGVSTVVLLFILYILYNSSISNLFANYKYILHNPEHSYSDLLTPIRSYIKYMGWTFKGIVISNFIVFLCACALYFVNHETWKRRINTYLYFIALLLVIYGIIFILNMDIDNKKILNHFLCVPLTVVGPTLYMLSNYKRKDIFFFMWILGLLYSIAITYASNTGINGATFGLIISAIASSVLIFGHSVELKSIYDISKKMIIGAVCCLQIFSILCVREFYTYRDKPVLHLDTRLSAGPAKGIYTTPESAEKYHDVIYAIDQYVPKNTSVFFSTLLPFGYLYDLVPATPILWSLPIKYDMFHVFFSLYPDKFPKCIFVLNADYGFHNELNGDEWEGILQEYMIHQQYERIELDCGVLFIDRQLDK